MLTLISCPVNEKTAWGSDLAATRRGSAEWENKQREKRGEERLESDELASRAFHAVRDTDLSRQIETLVRLPHKQKNPGQRI